MNATYSRGTRLKVVGYKEARSQTILVISLRTSSSLSGRDVILIIDDVGAVARAARREAELDETLARLVNDLHNHAHSNTTSSTGFQESPGFKLQASSFKSQIRRILKLRGVQNYGSDSTKRGKTLIARIALRGNRTLGGSMATTQVTTTPLMHEKNWQSKQSVKMILIHKRYNCFQKKSQQEHVHGDTTDTREFPCINIKMDLKMRSGV